MQSRFSNRYAFNSSTYICGCCKRRTRETGLGESQLDLCAYCYDAAGIENSFSDGHITTEQYKAEIIALNEQYGERAHIDCTQAVE